MRFREEIEQAIADEALKLSQRYHAYHNAMHLEHKRTAKLIRNPPAKTLHIPAHWTKDRKFNPFYVHKHRKAIARSISNAILSRSYVPHAPEKRTIPKSGGGTRDIYVYQIPDAAVSALFYKTLLRKNKHRFSGFSYAYRDDRNAHFAIQDISVDLADLSRVFVAEYDFSNFFDSISHTFLSAQFAKNGFSISVRDRHVIDSFLGSGGVGVPQGTSISLFLANLACWHLDRSLEQRGLRFARYADDTVIWSGDYAKISGAVELIADFSRETGVQINAKKSKGIRLLCSATMPSEFAARTDSIEFLGYAISSDAIAIKANSVSKMKRQISFLLYHHLIRPLRGKTLRAVEIPGGNKDKDLIAALASIRRYLYGNLSEDFISRYLAGHSSHLFYKGAMSFYPLLSDKRQMEELDGWITNQVWKAVRLRLRLLDKWGHHRAGRFPFNIARASFPESLRSVKVGKRRLYAIPSFVLVYLALRKAVSEGGVQQFLARDEY